MALYSIKILSSLSFSLAFLNMESILVVLQTTVAVWCTVLGAWRRLSMKN